MPYFFWTLVPPAERDIATADDGMAADILLGFDKDYGTAGFACDDRGGQPCRPAPITTTSAARSQSTGFWHSAAPGTALPNVRVIILLPFPRPYSGPEELWAQIDAVRASNVRPEYALIDLASGKPFGQASYLNIDPAAGSIEVGGIVYAPAFQRRIAASEAMYLMMRHAFDELCYRRYAWQCNSLNAKSRAAANRLGFTFEGVWRHANVHKG